MTEVLAKPAGLPAVSPPARKGQPFQPGRKKTGGRRKGVPNRDRALTIARIMQMVDPIEGLARIARGEPMMLAPEPGKPAALVYPTLADVRAALVALANKVMPDLKSVAVDGAAGTPVAVVIRFGPDNADDRV
jgi:hypothetical protein